MISISALLVEPLFNIAVTIAIYPLVSFLSYWHIAPISVALLAFSIAHQLSSDLDALLLITALASFLIGLSYIWGIATLRSDYVLLISVFVHLSLKYFLATDYGGLQGVYGLSIPAEYRIEGRTFDFIALLCIAIITVSFAIFESLYKAQISILRCDRGLAASYGLNRKYWLIAFSGIAFLLVGLLEALLICWAGSASGDLLSLNKAILPLAIILATSSGGAIRVLLIASGVYCLDAALIYAFYYDGQLAGVARTLLESIVILVAVGMLVGGKRSI